MNNFLCVFVLWCNILLHAVVFGAFVPRQPRVLWGSMTLCYSVYSKGFSCECDWVWPHETPGIHRNPIKMDADIALDARLPEQTRSQATRLQLLWIQKWGQIFRLVYNLYHFRSVYCIFVYVCVYVLFGSPSTCEVNVFFLSLPFDPDLNESWFKLWHVKTNLKDALGTGNRAASRRSGFKKSQIVKTSWSKFFVFQSSLSDFAPTARPRDARSKSRQVGLSCIRSRSRHGSVCEKRGLQGVSGHLEYPKNSTETPNCITGTGTFFFAWRTRNEISPGLDTQIRAARKALSA